MTRNKLYFVFLTACFIGFAYIFISIHAKQGKEVHLCFIKNVTGYPCPSCGTTRALQLLLEGKFRDSLYLNPLGIFTAFIMLTFPLWVLTDVVLKKSTFFLWFKKCEDNIRKPIIAIGLIVLVLLNWIWNLYKHL